MAIYMAGIDSTPQGAAEGGGEFERESHLEHNTAHNVASLSAAIREAGSAREVGELFEQAIKSGQFDKLDPRSKTVIEKDGYVIVLRNGSEDQAVTQKLEFAGSLGIRSAPRLLEHIDVGESHVYVLQYPEDLRFTHVLSSDAPRISQASIARLRQDMTALAKGGDSPSLIHALALEDESMRCWFVTDKGEIALTGWESLRVARPEEIADLPNQLNQMLAAVRQA